jgi:hypothetical protein
MAATPLVTDTEVLAIMDIDAFVKPADPFILAAATIRQDELDPLGTISDDMLKEIERWLSAHFYTVAFTRTDKEKIDDEEVTARSKIGMNLSLTHYGQMAMTLDTSGTLKELNNPKAATTAFDYMGDTYV